ncbi:hypothetical protein SBV1_120028 [Verrucomicrobia bacterium]|nr:hypothetical protein SBV1_120028 [Verrucomicrobiota bacterium]
MAGPAPSVGLPFFDAKWNNITSNQNPPYYEKNPPKKSGSTGRPPRESQAGLEHRSRRSGRDVRPRANPNGRNSVH